MYKKIVLLILFVISTTHGMEMELPNAIPIDVMPAIINYVISMTEKDRCLANNVVNKIKCNYTLQLVSKNFRRMFWDCFDLEEKDHVIKLLLRTDRKSSECFDIAVSMQASFAPVFWYMVNTKNFDQECARAILARDSTVINAIDDNCTPLYRAVNRGYWDIAKLLLSYETVDVNKTVPLYAAIRLKNIEMIKLLLAHPQIQINTLTECGDTALFAITEDFCRDVDELRLIIDLLLDAGIDASIKNEFGETALDVSRAQAQEVVAKELESALEKRNNV